jgi:hypothetical protein
VLQVDIEQLPSFILGYENGMRQMEESIKMGERNKAIMIAKQLIQRNLSVTDILEITGLDASDLPLFVDGSR